MLDHRRAEGKDVLRILFAGAVGLACFGVLLWCAYDGIRLLTRSGPEILWTTSAGGHRLGLRLVGDLAAMVLTAAAMVGCTRLLRFERPEARRRLPAGAIAIMLLAFAAPLTVLDAVMNPPVTAWTFVPGLGGAVTLAAGLYLARRAKRPGDP